MFNQAARHTAMLAMFARLQQRYGCELAALCDGARVEELHLPSPTSTSTSNSLTRDAIHRLFTHQTLALVVRRFVEPAAAAQLAAQLAAHGTTTWRVANPSGRDHVAHDEGFETERVSSVGIPFTEALRDGDAGVRRYFDAALPHMRLLRQLSHPHPCPIDKLRLELDELWPDGACVSHNKHGEPYAVGVARLMQPVAMTLEHEHEHEHELPPPPLAGSALVPSRQPYRDPQQQQQARVAQVLHHIQGFCHVDDLSPIRDDRGLFSANVYLQVPEPPPSSSSSSVEEWRRLGEGGLEVWDLRVSSRWDFYRNAVTLSMLLSEDERQQAVLRAQLPPPHLIVPEPGDLVLLAAQRPHAVRGFRFGQRITLQTFIQRNKRGPLMLDT